MIKYNFNSDKKIMEFFIGEKVTNEGYNQAMSKFEQDLKEHDDLKVIELITDFQGIEPLALWKDIKFSIREYGAINKKVSKCAIVADQKWIDTVTSLFKPFLETEIRFFPASEEPQARQWIEA